MSAATRLAAADTRITRDPHARPSFALNTAAVPGGLGCHPPTEPLHIAGQVWRPADCGPWACPIGAALAIETAARVGQ